MTASIVLAIPLYLSSCTNQTPLISRLKIELGVESITILCDNSYMSSSNQAMPSRTPSCNSSSLDPSTKSPICTSKTFLYPSLKQLSNVVECLRKPCVSK
jgi:hypothetical protein